MSTKVLKVEFINPVSLGGQIKSASTVSPANPDRPGSTPFTIELDEAATMFQITKKEAHRTVVKYVPMSNVSGFEVIPEAKKEEKPAVAPQVKK